MKMKLCIFGLVVLGLIALAAPPSGRVVLAWDYLTNEVTANLVFKLYASTNLSLPMTNWLVLTNVPGTNRSVPVTILPGPMFFTLTASNFWGESDFSNVASTPPLPRSDVALRISRDD